MTRKIFVCDGCKRAYRFQDCLWLDTEMNPRKRKPIPCCPVCRGRMDGYKLGADIRRKP